MTKHAQRQMEQKPRKGRKRRDKLLSEMWRQNSENHKRRNQEKNGNGKRGKKGPTQGKE